MPTLFHFRCACLRCRVLCDCFIVFLEDISPGHSVRRGLGSFTMWVVRRLFISSTGDCARVAAGGSLVVVGMQRDTNLRAPPSQCLEFVFRSKRCFTPAREWHCQLRWILAERYPTGCCVSLLPLVLRSCCGCGSWLGVECWWKKYMVGRLLSCSN